MFTKSSIWFTEFVRNKIITNLSKSFLVEIQPPVAIIWPINECIEVAVLYMASVIILFNGGTLSSILCGDFKAFVGCYVIACIEVTYVQT